MLGELSSAVGNFFSSLHGEHSERVALMTYSEFGRRVNENASRGTDHGSGSCMFVAGTQVVGGIVGKHPSLSDLTDGDIKYHTDFRRLYATLLDKWLGVDSTGVLGEEVRDARGSHRPQEEGARDRAARRGWSSARCAARGRTGGASPGREGVNSGSGFASPRFQRRPADWTLVVQASRLPWSFAGETPAPQFCPAV